MKPWGPLSLEEGQAARLRLGPLTLSIWREPGALRLVEERGQDPLVPNQVLEPLEAPIPQSARRLVLPAEGPLRLLPATADRPVVARPDHPVLLSPGARLTVYVATPLWLQLRQDQTLLLDLPVARPASTWFGPSPMDGELAYASRTSLHTSSGGLLPLLHRAATQIEIRNAASDSLNLQRLVLPVRQLALFEGSDGRPWTGGLRLERVEQDSAVLERVPDASHKPIASPRDPEPPSGLLRAFNAFAPRAL